MVTARIAYKICQFKAKNGNLLGGGECLVRFSSLPTSQGRKRLFFAERWQVAGLVWEVSGFLGNQGGTGMYP